MAAQQRAAISIHLYRTHIEKDAQFASMADVYRLLSNESVTVVNVGQLVFLHKDSGMITTVEPKCECIALVPDLNYGYTERLRKRLRRAKKSYATYCKERLLSCPLPGRNVIVGRSCNMAINPEDILCDAVMNRL